MSTTVRWVGVGGVPCEIVLAGDPSFRPAGAGVLLSPSFSGGEWLVEFTEAPDGVEVEVTRTVTIQSRSERGAA